MFNLETKISEWRRQMLAAGMASPVPLDELEAHLREEFEQLSKTGCAEAEAFERAVQKIGKAPVIQGEFKKDRVVKRRVGMENNGNCFWIGREWVSFMDCGHPASFQNWRFRGHDTGPANFWPCRRGPVHFARLGGAIELANPPCSARQARSGAPQPFFVLRRGSCGGLSSWTFSCRVTILPWASLAWRFCGHSLRRRER